MTSDARLISGGTPEALVHGTREEREDKGERKGR